MNKNISQKLIATAAILAIANIAAFSAAIPVFNTGVNNSGGLLPNTTVDSHYSLIAAPSPYNTAYTGRGNEMALGLPWLTEGPTSRWVNPSSWLGEWMPTGTYTYRTTFSLSGLNPGTASLNLNIASDNTCNVFLNGVHAGITTPFAGFSSFSAYNISSGFVNGLNTLDFEVFELGNTPSGLRVELTGTAAVVPEPTSLALIGLGGMMLVGLRRK